MRTPAKFNEFQLPCTDPERMDDWYISERSPLPEDEETDIRIVAAMGARMELGDSCTHDDEQRAADGAVESAVADLKTRRRKAIASCYFDCPMQARRMCLAEGLETKNLEHGIWGGYPESERRQVVAAIRRRDKGMSNDQAAHVIVNEEKKRALNGV